MKIEMTPERVAAIFGSTIAQASAALLRSARGIRELTERDLKRWHKTRAEADAIAADYERRAAL